MLSSSQQALQEWAYAQPQHCLPCFFVPYSPSSDIVRSVVFHGLVEDEVSGSSEDGFLGSLKALRVLISTPQEKSFALNVSLMLASQAMATAIAIWVDSLRFSDATAVIVFVLGVLVTAILTDGPIYSLVASVISILCYNYFLISPRGSLQIEGHDYAGTISAMFVFALLASYLVTSLRRSVHQSMEAMLVAEREQMRATMLRSVSHDLRTPLTSISGNADMLLDEEAHLSSQSRKQLLQDISDDATWLRTVVENLLAITRLEDGDVALNTEVELVDDVIEEAIRHISREASQHTIVVEPSNELLLARMDPQLIVQVIVNLVNNAITHTQAGSTIVISSYREESMVAIEVVDNGPGIADEDKGQIFEPFYSARTGTADSSRSVGLGLALCRTIVQAHGGSIHVSDVAPQGSRFVFTLPAEEITQHG